MYHRLQVVTVNLPPIDAGLDPKSLWAQGVELSNNGDFKEATWKFVVALFMDFALDDGDMEPVRNAIRGCDETGPVDLALSCIVSGEPRLQRAKEAYEITKDLARFDCPLPAIERGATIEDINDANRHAFGIGMCHIIHARDVRRYFIREFTNGTYVPDMGVFHRATRIVEEASWFIDPARWMTFQFELGYSAKDVFRVDDAERWLTKFVNTIDETGSLRLSNPESQQHWSSMKELAVDKLEQLRLT